jgi:hypothetical protein
VVERWQPPAQIPKGFILHLQDLHTHYGAQRTIVALIDALHRSTGVSLVALEGDAGPGDPGFFSAFPDHAITQALADFFMQKGLFTGPVVYAITHPGEIELYGVEDPALYFQHLKTYQTHAPSQPASSEHLATLSTALRALTDRVYPDALKTLTQQARAFEAGELPLSDYAQALEALAILHRLDIAPYPHLRRLWHLRRLERRQQRDKSHAASLAVNVSHLAQALDPTPLSMELAQCVSTLTQRLLTTPQQRQLAQLTRRDVDLGDSLSSPPRRRTAA